MADGNAAELLLIGSEGMTGGTQLLGPASLQVSCNVESEAKGYRVRFDDLNDLFHTLKELRSRLLEFLQHGSLTLSQIAGCSRLHRADQRLA